MSLSALKRGSRVELAPMNFCTASGDLEHFCTPVVVMTCFASRASGTPLQTVVILSQSASNLRKRKIGRNLSAMQCARLAHGIRASDWYSQRI